MLKKLNVFSIPFGVAFLPQLVDSIFNDEIISGASKLLDDPIKLSDLTIYLPTNRAVRQLREAFTQKTNFHSSFLPNICALADIDNNMLFFSDRQEQMLDLLPPIDELDRLLELAKLIQVWYANLPKGVSDINADYKFFLPTKFADSILIARDLSKFLDQIESYEVNWDNLQALDPGLKSEWWLLTWEFLEIVRKYFPQILQEKQRLSPIIWRLKLLEFERERLLNNARDNYIIAAGFVGMFPALDRFLGDIASLPNGAIAIPAVDKKLDNESWNKLNSHGTENAAIFCHPQKSIYQLLRTLGVNRADVITLGEATPLLAKRDSLVSELFRPAEATECWQTLDRDNIKDAVHDFTLVEATNEREEAAAIALIVRELLEDKNNKVAFVCTDPNFSRYVCSYLRKFNIVADKSSSQALFKSPQGIFVSLLLNFMVEPLQVEVLLSLFKHPLFKMGYSRHDIRPKIASLETSLFRKYTWTGALDSYLDYLAKNIKQDNELEQQSLELLRKFSEVISPFVQAKENGYKFSLNKLAQMTVEIIEQLIKDDNGSMFDFYENEAGESFVAFFKKLLLEKADVAVYACEWHETLQALWNNVRVNPSSGGHPRFYIWDNLESRLQNVDCVIIAGLNEGIWPLNSPNGQFLSRIMKMMVQLPPPEKDIGILAHDLQMLLGCKNVFLTRSLRFKNELMVASRWWRRLETVIGQELTSELKQKGNKYLYWVQQLDADLKLPMAARPAPKPPVIARPRSFWVTDIEKLRDNPYSIYCKKILNLKPFKELSNEFSNKERGNLLHRIFEKFTTEAGKKNDKEWLNLFLDISKEEFDKENLPDDCYYLWWHYLEKLSADFIDWYQQQDIRESYPELCSSEVTIADSDFKLQTRVDSLYLVGKEREVVISNLKTGNKISNADITKLNKIQLLLELLVTKNGGFKQAQHRDIKGALYLYWTAKGEFIKHCLYEDKKIVVEDLLTDLEHSLLDLLNSYDKEEQPYLSYVKPKDSRLSDPYDHIARVLEWSTHYDMDEE